MRPIVPVLALAATACQPIGLIGPQGAASGVVVPEGEVRVVSARATASRVTLRLSDGTRCSGERPEGELSGWSGVTSDCGYQLPYTVTFRQGASPQRFTVEAAPAGTGPRAEVFVTDVDGVRRLFAAPLGNSVRFEPQT